MFYTSIHLVTSTYTIHSEGAQKQKIQKHNRETEDSEWVNSYALFPLPMYSEV